MGFLNNNNKVYNDLNLKIENEKIIKTNVLLINLKKLKENNYQKEFKNIYIKYKDYKEMNDEIMINVLFKNKIGILPSKYGMPNFDNADLALEYNQKINENYRYDNNDFISAYYKPIIMVFICNPLELGNKCNNNEAFWYYAEKSVYFDEIKKEYGNKMK